MSTGQAALSPGHAAFTAGPATFTAGQAAPLDFVNRAGSIIYERSSAGQAALSAGHCNIGVPRLVRFNRAGSIIYEGSSAGQAALSAGQTALSAGQAAPFIDHTTDCIVHLPKQGNDWLVRAALHTIWPYLKTARREKRFCDRLTTLTATSVYFKSLRQSCFLSNVHAGVRT